MNALVYLLLGLTAGVVGGFFGLGGGIVLVPAFVYALGLTQHQAQGTALAVMVPPITILAALRYYYAGNVKLDLALFACLGFLVGGLLGAQAAQGVPSIVLKRLFGFVMMFAAIKMLIGK